MSMFATQADYWQARAERAEAFLAAFRHASKEAPDILDLMIRCSKSACNPMHHLLTTDGLYSFKMANLWVRDNGKEYVMEADWADNCGKLVKRLTELMAMEEPPRVIPDSECKQGRCGFTVTGCIWECKFDKIAGVTGQDCEATPNI